MLKKMNERAHKEGLNRVLNINDKNAVPEHKPVEVDMKMKVLLQKLLPYTHRNVEDKGSIRVMAIYGVVGQKEPQMGILDVPLLYKGTLEKNKIDMKVLEEGGDAPEPVDDEQEEA